MRITPILAAILALLAGAPSAAQADSVALEDAAAVPHIGDKGRTGYAEFLAAEPHRAFAIAPGGTWSWRSGMLTPELAEEAALGDCAGFTEQTCVAYAVDDQVVFDAAAWPTLWGPYATAEAAAEAPVGTGRGARFPDLAFTDPEGRAATLGALRGRVVVLHFWGAWCPPCQVEMPDLAGLYHAITDRPPLAWEIGPGIDPGVAPGITFVLLQVREPVARSRRWMKRRKLDLPVSDSGATGAAGEGLRLAAGGTLDERDLAPVFPSTYVLDAHGLVVFASRGPLSRWIEYAPFLRDAARHSGR